MNFDISVIHNPGQVSLVIAAGPLSLKLELKPEQSRGVATMLTEAADAASVLLAKPGGAPLSLVKK